MSAEGEVVEGELVPLVDAMPKPMEHPPAVRPSCACGKDGQPYSHGLLPGRKRAFSCSEVLEMRARVEAAAPREQRFPVRLVSRLMGGV
jgi:hypothetical protein